MVGGGEQKFQKAPEYFNMDTKDNWFLKEQGYKWLRNVGYESNIDQLWFWDGP